MGKIHALSAQVSNQIAAGEVIERPASVVKELVENSLDAQATQIRVKVRDGGLSLISVSDNGDGIASEDVPLAFARHATSKIATGADLFKIGTLGFRGEALASIGAVAKVTMTTSTANGLGETAVVNGGELLKQEKSSQPKGTTITVKDLFYNTPARLKYMKSVQTELAHIADIVDRIALGHPDVAFSLVNDTKTMVATVGNDDWQQTIAAIYGNSVARSLLPIKGHTLDYQVQGFVAKPEVTRASRNFISLLINGRYIKNYALNKALIAGYGTKLMVGRYPVAVVSVHMDPLLVDVNVHPTKQEVRLSKENELTTLLTDLVAKQLGEQRLIPSALENLYSHSRNTVPQPKEWADLSAQLDTMSQTAVPTQSGHATTEEPVVAEAEAHVATNGQFIAADALHPEDAFADPAVLAAWDQRVAQDQPALAFSTQSHPQAVTQTALVDNTNTPTKRFPQLHFLAQVHLTYLLAEGEDGLYILDQHAAQERVNYEKYRAQVGQIKPDQQTLLVPLILDYSAADYTTIAAHLPDLAQAGIELAPFGDNTFVVHSHPAWFAQKDTEAMIREMIDYFLTDHTLSLTKFLNKATALISCKASIKANTYITPQQAQHLLDSLRDCENPFNCPHGRPTITHFTDRDLARMFKRIQDSHHAWGGE
ncbi:DNA mismatch repair endonuclease MutL [Schleiferilactobacillus perolens]|jgi:DNA mismatch repair protein MutL|uniref:DNA mismatch repair endonuclease MutL n=1 Tax=Schleiferilactobacillus perolens TaxID=100468 RepID=UPI002355538B|nr:DNA mismatch repair endonuclease MutL [Schleiferilactobacillus perolens]MCI2172380.1 DNA mismatch repair endonuclease MutL [Schleiferilactobacillus perolens]